MERGFLPVTIIKHLGLVGEHVKRQLVYQVARAACESHAALLGMLRKADLGGNNPLMVHGHTINRSLADTYEGELRQFNTSRSTIVNLFGGEHVSYVDHTRITTDNGRRQVVVVMLVAMLRVNDKLHEHFVLLSWHEKLGAWCVFSTGEVVDMRLTALPAVVIDPENPGTDCPSIEEVIAGHKLNVECA